MHQGAGLYRPLDGYRVRASIDWVEFLVTLPAPSQFRHVQARAPTHWGKVFIDAIEGNATSRQFRLRIQNPGPPTQVLRELQSLSPNDMPIHDHDVQVTGLEVAVDFIPETEQQRAHLAHVVAYLHENMAKPPSGPHRLLYSYRLPVSGETIGEVKAAAGRAAIVSAISAGRSLVIGEKDATDRARFYRKDYDTRPRQSYTPTPPAQHCARMERTLTGTPTSTDCHIRTLADWRAFRFETLAGKFALVLPAQDSPPLTTTMRVAWGPALGTPDDPKKRAHHRRQSAPATRRDTLLNGRIRQALRGLTGRMARAESAEIRCTAAT